MSYDVAVVGAGPAGLICASELEKLGEKTTVLEKGGRVGEPVACAGLFSIDGMKRLGIEKGDYILNEVKGARFICSTGEHAEIKGRENKAFVVDRGEFDRFLASKYQGELSLNSEVLKIHKKKGIYSLAASGGPVEAKNIVIATGCEQKLHGKVKLRGPKTFISTSQYEIDGIECDPSYVELYLGSVAPGFFGWVIPINHRKARVGVGVLGSKKSTHKTMENFLKRLRKEKRFKEKNKAMQRSGGLIPVYEPKLKVSKDGAYLVGDAAGQVKATTGGGVMLGGLAAKILARAIHEGRSYEHWLEPIDKELDNHLLIRNVMNKFGDEEYQHMVEFMNKPEIKDVIEQYGDMDMVSPIIKTVMKDPVLLMKAMKMIGGQMLF